MKPKVYELEVIFVLCFIVSFINCDFDHYIFILGGALEKKKKEFNF